MKKDLPPLKYDVPDDFDPKKFKIQWDRIIALSHEKLLEERKLFLLNQEIEKAWKQLPVTVKPRAFLPCRQCGEVTQDRFGGTAMCSRHVFKGDAAVSGIIENLMYGSDDDPA